MSQNDTLIQELQRFKEDATLSLGRTAGTRYGAK